MSNSSRENILERIKNIMEEGREYAFPLSDSDKNEFPEPTDLLLTFKEELETIGGNVIIGENQEDTYQKLADLIAERGLQNVFCVDHDIQEQLKGKVLWENNNEIYADMQASITRCECLIARTGTVVINSAHPSGRRLNVFPPIHFVVAKYSQLVSNPHKAMEHLENKFHGELPSLISFVTGASRTADIEKTLVMGAHGPKEIFVFIDKNG